MTINLLGMNITYQMTSSVIIQNFQKRHKIVFLAEIES